MVCLTVESFLYSSSTLVQATWRFNRWQITENEKSLEYIEKQRAENPKLLNNAKPYEVGTLVLEDVDTTFTFELEKNQWFDVDKKAGTVGFWSSFRLFK